MSSATYNLAPFLEKQFSATLPGPQLALVTYLKDIHPNSQLVSTCVTWDWSFPLTGYLSTIDITPSVIAPQSHHLFSYDSSKGQEKVYPHVIAGVVTFTYSSVDFAVYKAVWTTERRPHIFYGLVFNGENDSVGQNLMSEVYRWADKTKEEIWVFEDGNWSKNKELYKAIKSASWEDVVLNEDFKEGLRRDTDTFFSSREVYGSLGITWKRGILLLGPPGNGKTESIKALLNETNYDALYVKSFTTSSGPEHGVKAIFDHARRHSPCILILEDLDAMVTDTARSYFLNELDGLAHNDGILTIATTNHPERIDDAILNRPSRFDVKYNFDLPTHDLRKAYAAKWVSKIQKLETEAGRGSGFQSPLEEISASVAAKTEGWSFAFLKELFVSFLLRMAHDRSISTLSKTQPGASADGSETHDTVLLNQIDRLASQIIKISDAEKDKQAETAADAKANPLAGRRIARPMYQVAEPAPGPGF